jgi:hypothetical protein
MRQPATNCERELPSAVKVTQRRSKGSENPSVLQPTGKNGRALLSQISRTPSAPNPAVHSGPTGTEVRRSQQSFPGTGGVK